VSKIEDEQSPRTSLKAATDGIATPEDLSIEQMRLRIGMLVGEVTALRDAARKKNALDKLVMQLRDANQNLVLATLNAQSLQDESDTASRKQDEYLSMLAHELRNPLGPITTAATMLGKISGASPQLRTLQKIISRQAAHMARLLDDLLDAARINSGKVRLLVQPVFLNEVLERAIETVQAFLEQRAQKLKLQIPVDPVLINGDAVRLTQIFANLLVNASKYSGDQQEITLTAAIIDSDIVVSVRDSGVGIPTDFLPSIFELFTQSARPLARSQGGLGLGLYIVRNLVHLHKGTVEARSDGLDKGSIFTVTLPVNGLGLHSEQIDPDLGLQPKVLHILLIEDGIDAREAMRSFLEFEGHTVSAAADGEEGFLMAATQAYDVLICDIGLPRMDGIELMQQLRTDGRRTVPFAIALSGYGDALIRTQAKDAGFDRYLVKPVDPHTLLRLLAEL
jgi:signal transduction histidine kinase